MAKASISAALTDSQIPSIPNISGRTNTDAISRTRVLTNETTAETTPLLRAVNHADANILNPQRRKLSI